MQLSYVKTQFDAVYLRIPRDSEHSDRQAQNEERNKQPCAYKVAWLAWSTALFERPSTPSAQTLNRESML